MFVPILVLVLLYTNAQSFTEEKGIVWTVRNKNKTIEVPGKVPGGIYSDLYYAGVIGDILTGFNDVETRWIAHETWTYSGQIYFTAEQLKYSCANLVLEAVDTIAFIELNGSPIGFTTNMFVRYSYDVKNRLRIGSNKIEVTFASPIEAANVRSNKHPTVPNCVPDIYNGECHANQLRKMQASFGWDWGPAFPSVGLWRDAYFQFYSGAVITAITTQIEKIDHHWCIRTFTYLETHENVSIRDASVTAVLFVNGNQKVEQTKDVNVVVKDDGTFVVKLKLYVRENLVSLWWPNGYGDQPLYNLKITFSCRVDNVKQQASKSVNIGFRTIELVEEEAQKIFGPDTDAGNGLTFYFKVNNYPIFMKGSNWIPSHILPELSDNVEMLDTLLLSARDAYMAMLRVWGGGIYESDYFYQRCDELGILIWQDLLFACSMYPADTDFLDNVKQEVKYNVKRLQHHTSIAIWAGNNENEVALSDNWYDTASNLKRYKEDYIKLYVLTIKPIIAALDPGRPYIVSSPTNGRKSEAEGYIAKDPYDPHYGDTHYYNYLADNWDASTYPKTRFASEYGFQSMPSLATMMTATIKYSDYSITSAYSKHRQHSPNGYEWIEKQMTRYLSLPAKDKKYFAKYVYYSQISQAMAIKTATETYRQNQEDWYTMGALYWQLNDVWQAPSWSGIEFGGRWKMLHYFAKNFFAPVLVSPRLKESGDVDVYLINDRFTPIIGGQIIVDYFKYSSLTPVTSEIYPASVGPLSAKKQTEIKLWKDGHRATTFLRFALKAAGVASSPYNYIFPRAIRDVVGLRDPNITITVTACAEMAPLHQSAEYNVVINSDTIVLFLWLETLITGQFSDNGLIITEPEVLITFTTKKHVTAQELEESITAKYYTN